MTIADILTTYEVDAGQVALDLLTAARVLRNRGWATGVLEDLRNRRVCVDGALRLAITGRVDPYPHHPDLYRVDAARAVLIITLGLLDDVDLWRWNDDLCTSDAQAAGVLEQAAARVEAEAGTRLADFQQVMAA